MGFVDSKRQTIWHASRVVSQPGAPVANSVRFLRTSHLAHTLTQNARYTCPYLTGDDIFIIRPGLPKGMPKGRHYQYGHANLDLFSPRVTRFPKTNSIGMPVG